MQILLKLGWSFVSLALCPLAIMLMWNWYVVKIALPGIDYKTAIGLLLLINIIRFDPTKEQNEFDWTESIGYFLGLWLTVFVAYVIQAVF